MILIRNFWTITFKSNHSTTYTNYSILIINLIILKNLILIIDYIIHIHKLTGLSRVHHLIILSLISKSSHHHIGWLLMRWLIDLRHKSMRHITVHNYIILFYYCYSIYVLSILIILLHILKLVSLRIQLLIVMKLLCLNYITTKHLRIFNFYLWIIKYVIVVIYVFYYFNWLILIFLFWF